jgi:hypothetical protein
MKNLGKIFLFLLLTNVTLLAGVSATLDSRVVYRGESAIYKLTISGEDITKPALTEICGNDVVSTGSQTNITSINGNYSKSYTLSYEFTPQSSCTIEPVTVMIDGKAEKSNSVELIVKEPTQDKQAEFRLNLEASKKRLYVGEPFKLTLTLKQRRNAQAVDSKFLAPDFKGFWVKSESQPSRVDNGEDIVTTVVYTLAAQREGNVTIEPAQLKIASRVLGRGGWGSFAPQVKWKSYYSNKLTLDIKPIPNAASLIGDFTISAQVDKKEINANEALNLTLVVEGVGNLEDIKSFKPYIQNVNVFDEKIVVKGNKLTQKLAFVSDSDFTIPSFELVFFSTKTQTLQKIKTQPIKIKVNGSTQSKELKIKRDESVAAPVAQTKEVIKTVTDKSLIAIAFFIGLIVGIALMILKSFSFSKKEKSLNIKDEKLLIMKLLPYKEDMDVQTILTLLENNLYSAHKEKIDKKLLKEILKRYNIS